jgi:hypothetical protein
VIDAVERERERIVGLIELVPYVHGKTPEGIVQDQMERLSEDNMIGANAGILTFVKSADRNGCRLVMSSDEISVIAHPLRPIDSGGRRGIPESGLL